MGTREKVLIANGQGFWGDSILGPIRLVNEGPLDYLTLDYLAEVTMSIMQKLKSRNPQAGYATDFVGSILRLAGRRLPMSSVGRGTRESKSQSLKEMIFCRTSKR
jgi:hypothetical protein